MLLSKKQLINTETAVLETELAGLAAASPGKATSITDISDASTILGGFNGIRDRQNYQFNSATHRLYSSEFESLNFLVMNTASTLTLSNSAGATHPGVIRLGTSTTQGTQCSWGFGHHGSSGQAHRQFDISNIKRVKLICRFPTDVSSLDFVFGMYSSARNQNYNTDGIFFYATGGSMGMKTRSGGTQTVTSFGALSANTWYELEIVKESAAAYRFYVNGSSVAYHTANIPTGICGVGGNIKTATTAVRDVDLDYMEAELEITGNRY